MLGHNNLLNYYTKIFKLSKLHGYAINDLENLPAFELEIYQDLLIAHLHKEAQGGK
jgi:hypothetical protein